MSGSVCVVVLGDFGRSPRMQYHAISLANQAKKDVFVVATGAERAFLFRVRISVYSQVSHLAGTDAGGSNPHEAVTSNPKIHLRLIPNPPVWISRLPRSVGLPFKALFQYAALLLVRTQFAFLVARRPSSVG